MQITMRDTQRDAKTVVEISRETPRKMAGFLLRNIKPAHRWVAIASTGRADGVKRRSPKIRDGQDNRSAAELQL